MVLRFRGAGLGARHGVGIGIGDLRGIGIGDGTAVADGFLRTITMDRHGMITTIIDPSIGRVQVRRGLPDVRDIPEMTEAADLRELILGLIIVAVVADR